MVATRQKRHLFGGALSCAGLAGALATSSTSAEFLPSASYGLFSGETIVYAEDVTGAGFGSYAYESNAGSFVDSLSYSYTGWTGSAYAGPFVIGASISVFDSQLWVDAFASVFQWVEVAHAKQVLIEWDFTGMESGGARVYQYSSGTIFQIGTHLGSDPVGSMLLTLLPGEPYLLECGVRATDDNSGTGFVRFTSIPAPGVLCVLDLGAFTPRRRRRLD